MQPSTARGEGTEAQFTLPHLLIKSSHENTVNDDKFQLETKKLNLSEFKNSQYSKHDKNISGQ